jgi:ABC-2 type transport system permease protein
MVAYATLPVTVESMGLYTQTPDGQIKKAEPASREAVIFVPMSIMMLMFMVIMVAAQPLMTSVLEEKSLRIAEVLLGSASPFQIMMGKLIGNVGVSLTMITVYMAGGVFLLRYYDMPDLITRDIIIWFVIYQILAIFVYGSVFVAIGAACSDIKEAQSYLTPVMLTLVFPLMVWFQVLREPMGKFATWISLFPPFTPMLMVMRMASTKTIPVWQPLVGVVLVVMAVIVCVFAAGRIFRIGLLSQGKAPKPAELMRWIISG